MKQIMILLFVVSILSSSSFTGKTDCDKRLLGNWLLINANGVSGNSCPNVEFIDCKKAILIKPSREKFVFEFEAKNDSIIFNFASKKLVFFSEKKFSYKIDELDNTITLKLFSHESSYTLARGK